MAALLGDAWALFTQLDRDGDAEVNVDEFLEGCMLLKGLGAPEQGPGKHREPHQAWLQLIGEGCFVESNSVPQSAGLTIDELGTQTDFPILRG